MKKVMFVCMGNICRSPLGQAVFEHIVQQENAEDQYSADSTGTIAYHVGEPSDPRMRAVAARHRVPINHRAQHLKPKHLDEFDLILCMDSDNLHDAMRLAKTEEQRSKVRLLRDYDPEGRGDVPDPYYGGEAGFERVFDMVWRSGKALFEELERQHD